MGLCQDIDCDPATVTAAAVISGYEGRCIVFMRNVMNLYDEGKP